MNEGRNLDIQDKRKDLSPDQRQQQEKLQYRVDELRKHEELKQQELATQAEIADLEERFSPEKQLSDLEKKIQALDGRNNELFLEQVRKIEEELKTIEETYSQITQLKAAVKIPSHLQNSIGEAFPDSSEKANS